MKLLLIAEGYHPIIGGGARYMLAVVNHFRGKGHIVDVLTINTSSRLSIEKEEGGTIIRLPRFFRVSSASISLNFLSWMMKNLAHYDVLHFNAPNPIGELSYMVARALNRSRPKTVTIIHGEVAPENLIRKMYNRLVLARHLQAVDRILVSSPSYRVSSSMLRQFEGKITAIPFGIDLSFFASLDSNQKTGLVEEPSQELNLLFVGRIVPIKGLDYLLSAMTDAPGRLTIIGTGLQEGELKCQVEALGLQDRVRFLGEIRDDKTLRKHYVEADVIVLPSTKEAFGYVLIEAMACKTAVISTELGTGTSFVNLHNKTGLVVEPRNPHALAEAIRKLDRDRALLSQFKLAARHRVEEMFDVRTMLERTEAVYRELVARM